MTNRYFKTLILLFLLTVHLGASAQIIRTVAGNGSAALAGSPSYGDSGLARHAIIGAPWGVAVDTSGNIFVTDYNNNNVRKINAAGIITTYAGTGYGGYSGTGGAATAARLFYPEGISTDKLGNVFIGDAVNDMVRVVNTAGFINIAAGLPPPSAPGYNGDGLPATNAKLNGMANVFCDQSNNLYIADNNTRVRKVTLDGIIHTVAGSGRVGYSGNGHLATDTSVAMDGIQGVCVDLHGNIYIADYNNAVVRKVDAATGIISTFVGIAGSLASSGDGGLATAARVRQPVSVASDNIGNIYVLDKSSARIRKIDTSGYISTFCGTGTSGFSGDGGAPALAQISSATNIWIDRYNNLFIADQGNHRVREIYYPTAMRLSSNPDTTLICEGTSVTFKANTTLAGYGAIYKWYVNGSIVGTDTSTYTTNTLHTGDHIYCKLVDTAGGNVTLTSSDTITMTVDPINHPILSVTTTGDTVCFGLPVTLTATATNAGIPPSIIWKKFYTTVDSGMSYTLIPNNGDPVKCILTSNIACSVPAEIDTTFTMVATTSYHPSIVLHASPSDSITVLGQLITMFSDVTYGGDAPTFQWYQNGHPIAGATNNSYSAHFYYNDSFYCVVHSNALCVVPDVDTSNRIYIHTGYVLGADALTTGDKNISLWPNPTTGTVTISAAENIFTGATVVAEVRDVMGRLVYTTSLPVINNVLKGNITLPDEVTSGMYYLSLHDDTNMHILSFLIKH